MVIAIVGVDAAGIVQWWNSAASTMFGYGQADVVGHPVDLLVPEEFRDRHREGFRRVMTGGERHLEGASRLI
jgi:PAS domain S-box-containing protein